MIIPLIFVLRRSLQETEAFLQRKHRPDTREIFATIAKNWRMITTGTLLVAMTTTWPVMQWLTAAPDFTRMTLVLLWFSFFFGMYNGAMVAALCGLAATAMLFVRLSRGYIAAENKA
ncbi:citrate-proton symporter [Salmonella enterica]|nr:citrate-proton symporter [Salmonella enterica]